MKLRKSKIKVQIFEDNDTEEGEDEQDNKDEEEAEYEENVYRIAV